jgi:hypothetical protein
MISITALAIACGKPMDPQQRQPDGSSSSNDMAQSFNGTCCLNQVFYVCSTKPAFDKCAGFDVAACFAACDPTNAGCFANCNQQASMSTHDPSQCTHDASRDNTCPSSGPVCVGTWNGQACDFTSQCSTGHCNNHKCYADDIGNPCEFGSECNSGNCTNNCCQDTTVGSPCDFSSQCNSGNCTNHVCQ